MANQQLSSKHLLGIKDLSTEDIRLIFHTATNFKEVINRPIKKVPSLRDITIANLFFEDSTRTRVSFELAEKRLSADTINFSASSSSVKKGETLLDTVNNILSMKVDMVVMRHPAPGACQFLAQHIDANIINAGDGTHEHPTQALLDAFSMQEQLGDLEGKNVAIFGDILHSRVALSNIFCLQKLGAKVRVCGPPTLMPKFIHKLGVGVSYNVRETLQWCDVANVLRIQLERQNIKYFPTLREYSQYFGINRQLLDSLDKKIVIMHPGPINRGVEITSDVADSEHSIILQQVENGVAVRMAVLFLLAARRSGISFGFVFFTASQKRSKVAPRPPQGTTFGIRPRKPAVAKNLVNPSRHLVIKNPLSPPPSTKMRTFTSGYLRSDQSAKDCPGYTSLASLEVLDRSIDSSWWRQVGPECPFDRTR